MPRHTPNDGIRQNRGLSGTVISAPDDCAGPIFKLRLVMAKVQFIGPTGTWVQEWVCGDGPLRVEKPTPRMFAVPFCPDPGATMRCISKLIARPIRI